MQMETDGEANLPGKSWLPFGFFWVPSKSDTQLLPSSDGPTKTMLAKYLKVGVYNLHYEYFEREHHLLKILASKR